MTSPINIPHARKRLKLYGDTWTNTEVESMLDELEPLRAMQERLEEALRYDPGANANDQMLQRFLERIRDGG